MLRKLIVIPFLSIFVALPSVANCKPPDDGKNYVLYARTKGLELACTFGTGQGNVSGKRYSGNFSDYSDWYQFDLVFRWELPFLEINYSDIPKTVKKGYVNPDGIDGVANSFCITDGDFNYNLSTVQTTFVGSPYQRPSKYARGINPQIAFVEAGKPFSQALICEPFNSNDDDDDDDDECPNLNLRIRGTLLPSRRGTARVSGDWCH